MRILNNIYCFDKISVGKMGEYSMLRFVKAQYPGSHKYYDYICDIEDIKKGDEVLVTKKYGEKVVAVRDSFFSNLEDMPLLAQNFIDFSPSLMYNIIVY